MLLHMISIPSTPILSTQTCSKMQLRWAALALVLAALNSHVVSQNVTYDYVIAGAGTAGMLLAVVLSENPNITVAVLEAGSDGRTQPNITIPERRGTSDPAL